MFCCSLGFGILCAAPVVTDGAHRDYLVKNWTTADGVPHNTVRAVIESRDGYLWLGTANGLARFDGVRFVVFDLARTPGLLSDDIFNLHEDSDGTLWMRTRRGLARRHQGRFEFLSLTNGGPPVMLGHFAEDTQGRLWMRGEKNLVAFWNREKLEIVPVPSDGPAEILHLCAAKEGGLWLAAKDGLWRLLEGVWTRVQRVNGLVRLACGPDGRLWAIVGEQRLFVWDRRQWSQVADFSGERCRSLHASRNGDVWAGSETGNQAFRLRDGALSVVNGADGLEGNRVLCFMDDRDGNLWLGLNAGGLFRLRERRVQLYDRKDGLELLNISSLGQDTHGTILASVMGSTLHEFRDGRFFPIRVSAKSEPYSMPTAVMPARSGGSWSGTFYGSLPRILNGREVERVGSGDGTRSLFTDREGRLWRGTRMGGVECFDGTNVTRYTTNQGLSFDNVYSLAQDKEGAVWVGTEQGLNRIFQGRITTYGISNGLGNGFISCLAVDSRGLLWAGTLGGGLSAWNGRRFITLTTQSGLPHDNVEQLVEDDHGHLWVGTRGGLMRLSLAQLHEFVQGKIRNVAGTLVAREEGLSRPNFWTEYQPASLKARDGRLWFATGSGVVMIDPQRFESATSEPRVHVEEVAIDGVNVPNSDTHRSPILLPPGSERLEIRFTGISPSAPEQVRFNYRLEGYDRDWIDAGRTRFASYSHLPPGQYRFQVKAINNDGVWAAETAAIALVMQPRFWQQGWFRAALVAVFALAFWRMDRWRVTRVERRRAAQEEFSRKLIDSQEQERKRIAAELHDSLGQNLLVIKNRAALALKQREEPEKMAAQIDEVSNIASAAIREVREIAQNLRPFQIDELGLTKSIVAMARNLGDAAGIEFETDLEEIDGGSKPEFSINFYRIVQECLSNVVKHSRARTARIQLRRSASTLWLKVEDDGCGFAVPGVLGGAGGGFGLRNIVERARTMGGDAVFESKPGQGTRVEVTVPMPRG